MVNYCMINEPCRVRPRMICGEYKRASCKPDDTVLLTCACMVPVFFYPLALKNKLEV